VGFLQSIGLRHDVTASALSSVVDEVQASIGGQVDPSTLPYATPWGQSDLQRLVFEDVFPGGIPCNSRSAAMRIPAVARARNLIVSTICPLPLEVFRKDVKLDDTAQPSWTYRTDTVTTPQHRLAWTIDDLIFYGWSCWWRTNGADGFPIAADRLNQGDWSINKDNRVEVNGQVVDDNRVIVIPGLHEGILTYGVDAIRDTRRLYEIVRDRLENPVPSLDLHQTEGEDMTKGERDDLLKLWREARRSTGGAAVGYSNKAIQVRELGQTAGGEQLLVEARNAAALDLARVVGVGASRIDATAPKASLNYETTTGRNQEFIDFDLGLYITPITARLSMDDVVPRGQRSTFDLTQLAGLAPSLTGPADQD
jgi:hypothetical protein